MLAVKERARTHVSDAGWEHYVHEPTVLEARRPQCFEPVWEPNRLQTAAVGERLVVYRF